MDELKDINEVALEILKIAEELASKKPLDVRVLYKTARKRLKYSDDDINKAIYDFILKKIIIPERKIVKTQVLSNERRDIIFDYIRKTPGAHLREIREKLKLNPHVASLHLKILENFEFIYGKKHLKYRVFFPTDFNRENEEPILALKNEKAENIYFFVKEQGEISQKQIQEEFSDEISPKMINYHLEPLILAGLIEQVNRDDQELLKINEDKFDKLERYLQPKLELIRIAREEAVKAPTPEAEAQAPELIEVKREYDFVGGEIRFKTAVQNTSKSVVTGINVTIIPTSQYEVEDKVKTVDILKPGETRGVDFYLIPLTCGRSQVFGSVTYVDPFGTPISATIQPKDIWIKCPLVIPKAASIEQIEDIKKQLQKGIARIDFSINRNSAFDIVRDQIAALDLSDVLIDEDNLLTLHSGLAKVTNDNMIIESRISDNQAVLTVWTRDMKQATGFLAYIKNLINMSFQSHSILEGKIEKVSQKILDTTDIFHRFTALFTYCEENWSVGDIILLINEIKSKTARSLPGSYMIEKLKDWVEKFEGKREGDPISEQDRNDLEYDVLNWLIEVNKIGCNQIGMYEQSFPEKKLEIENLCSLTDKEDEIVRELERVYAKNILEYLMVILKVSGLSIYQYNFKHAEIEPDLISGFLTAIQDFGTEISRGEDTTMKKLAYKNFQIEIESGQNVRTALFLKGEPVEILQSKLKTFTEEFENAHGHALETFSGDVKEFRQSVDLAKKIFL